MRIVSFNFDQDNGHTASLISCYQAVFGAPPWNEDWWTPGLVSEELKRFNTPQSVSLLAVTESTVIGFCWGAVYTPTDLEIELGLRVPGCTSEVLYIKDIGVQSQYRNQGIAKCLFRSLVHRLAGVADSARWVAARTLGQPQPSVLYEWFQREYGFTVGAEYSAADCRVILVQEYDALKQCI